MTPVWPPFPEVTHVIGREEIDAYADLSGDVNPLHMDPRYAATTQFGTVIAHATADEDRDIAADTHLAKVEQARVSDFNSRHRSPETYTVLTETPDVR